MAFEEGDAWSDARIESCDPPHRLGLAVGDWRLELSLEQRGDHTELTFIQHRETTDGAGEIGPGWEYYLDNLLASRTGSPLPDFADYYPSMQAYYEDQAAATTAPPVRSSSAAPRHERRLSRGVWPLTGAAVAFLAIYTWPL